MPDNDVVDVALLRYERRLVEIVPSAPRCGTPYPPTLDDVLTLHCQLAAGHASWLRHWHWTSIDVTWPASPADG